MRAGQVDLRTLLLEMPEGKWYITMTEGTIDDPQALIPQSEPLAESDYFPGDGYFLGSEEPPDEAEIQRTLERGKAVALTGHIEHVPRSAGQWSLLTEHGIKTGKTNPRGRSLN